MILIPKYKTIHIELPRLVMARYSGHFRIESFKTDSWDNEIKGSRRTRADWFDNLILNQGFNYMSRGVLGVVGYIGECAVGSGTTQPTVVQTGLQAFVAGTTNLTVNTFTAEGGVPYYGSRTFTWRFSEGQAAGNISEVGVGNGNCNVNGTDLFSRARIQVAGVDGTITVEPDEWLDVVYQVRAYPGVLVDSIGSFPVSAVDTDYVLRNASVADANSWGLPCGTQIFPHNTSLGGFISTYASTSVLGAVTGTPTDPSGGEWTTYSEGSYSADSFTQVVNFSGSLTQGNATGGIGAIRLRTNLGAIQFSLDPVIDKDATKVFDITLSYAWAAVVVP